MIFLHFENVIPKAMIVISHRLILPERVGDLLENTGFVAFSS